MFNLFGRKEPSKKSMLEKESDGFVIVGETLEEEKKKQKSQQVAPVTGVIVQPLKTPFENQVQPTTGQWTPTPVPADSEGGPSLPELLSDVPFTLAPHILVMQTGLQHFPDMLLLQDINDNLASFCYDFTLENSVLCDS